MARPFHGHATRAGLTFLEGLQIRHEASRSSLGSVYDFMSGLRVAFVLAVMPFASVIHERISAADYLLPTPSSGPFLFPLSPIE